MSIKSDDGHELTHNYRSLQALNARALVYVVDDNAESSASKSIISLITVSLIFVVSAFL
jgi:hypothetical protein